MKDVEFESQVGLKDPRIDNAFRVDRQQNLRIFYSEAPPSPWGLLRESFAFRFSITACVSPVPVRSLLLPLFDPI